MSTLNLWLFLINIELLSCAGYNATDIFKEDHVIDLEGLDKSAERVADLLSSETAKSELFIIISQNENAFW